MICVFVWMDIPSRRGVEWNLFSFRTMDAMIGLGNEDIINWAKYFWKTI